MVEIIGLLIPGFLLGYLLGRVTVLWNKRNILLYKKLNAFYRSLPDALQASLFIKSTETLPFNALVRQIAETFSQVSAVALYLFTDDMEQTLSLKGSWSDKSVTTSFPSILSITSLNIPSFPKEMLISQSNPPFSYSKELYWLYLALKERGQNLGLLILCVHKKEGIQRSKWIRTLLEAGKTLSKGIALISDISYLAEEQNERAKKKQLEEMHTLLYSKKLPKHADAVLDSFYIPASGINSDFIDYVLLPNNQFYLIHGEATGKGFSAILTSVTITVVLHLMAPVVKKPEAICNRLNWIFCKVLKGDFYSSLILLHVDLSKKIISYSKAGNSGALLCSFFQQPPFQSLEGDIPLGIAKSSRYQSHQYPIQSGDIWILYSDGLVEAKNKYGETFGTDRIKAIVNEHKFDSAHSIQKAMKHHLLELRKGEPLEDDASAVILKFR